MQQVVLLTLTQKQSLEGVEFKEDNLFNPIQDINDNWVISEEEQEQCSLQWLKLLPLSTYLPKPAQPLF